MIYVGIDLHRKWSQVAALDTAGEPRLSRRIPSRPEEFFRVFGELGPEPMEVAFEATPTQRSVGTPAPNTLRVPGPRPAGAVVKPLEKSRPKAANAESSVLLDNDRCLHR